jgi:hypothetical protein
MCDSDWDEGPAIAAHEWRRARKRHECVACDEGIERAELYHLTRQLYDGSWDTWKHCARCYAICKALWNAGAGGIDLELDCGEVWDDNFDPDPNVERLAFLTRAEAQAWASTV